MKYSKKYTKKIKTIKMKMKAKIMQKMKKMKIAKIP